ncbi:MAG: hypothetical protein LBP88_04880 [Treponema sp.]|jgi:hypothetical protein|nr:hypothetical protein [Treponema sp.]
MTEKKKPKEKRSVFSVLFIKIHGFLPKMKRKRGFHDFLPLLDKRLKSDILKTVLFWETGERKSGQSWVCDPK